MKRKLLFVVAMLLVWVISTRAQVAKPKFSFIFLTGMLHGSTSNELQFQTINGVSYRGFFAGAGIGIDYYYGRSAPVFIDLRKNILKKQQSPFVYIDFGRSFSLLKKEEENEWVRYSYPPAGYFDLGAGYVVPIKGGNSLSFSLGYSQKNLREKRTTRDGWITINEQPTQVQVTDYTLRRLSFKTGLAF